MVQRRGLPWLVLRAELVGTAALVLVGLSFVILMFGEGSPIPSVLPSEGWRRLITGFLFGTTGASIALSPVGRRSGAHINPIVTLAFRLMGKLDREQKFYLALPVGHNIQVCWVRLPADRHDAALLALAPRPLCRSNDPASS